METSTVLVAGGFALRAVRLRADRQRLKRPRVQDADRPAHVEALAGPLRARRPRVDVKACILVPRPERPDRIVGDRWRKRDIGQESAVRSPEPQLAVGLSFHLVSLLVDGAVMPPAERREV